MDSYNAHVRNSTPQLLLENEIIVVGPLAHTPDVIKPLEVSVFGSYKYQFQRVVHSSARV